jgi:hypothetical protein
VLASAFCLCSRCVGTHKRSPASFPLPDTRRCSTCPTLSRTNRVGVHTSLLSQKPFSFLPTSDQDRMIQVQMLASTKECFCIERNTLPPWLAQSELWTAIRHFPSTPAAASLRTAGAGFWALRVATLRVSNCEQMFADSGVILCVHSVGSETKTFQPRCPQDPRQQPRCVIPGDCSLRANCCLFYKHTSSVARPFPASLPAYERRGSSRAVYIDGQE